MDVINRMSACDRDNYDKVAQYQLTEEGYRRKFRSAKPDRGERPQQFATRLKGYFTQCIEMSGIEKDYDNLLDLVLREQFLNNCSREVVAFLKERKCDTFDAASNSAETYVNAHGLHTFGHMPKTDHSQRGGGPKPNQGGPNPNQGGPRPSQGGPRQGQGGPKPPQRLSESWNRNPNFQPRRTQYGSGREQGHMGCYQCGSPAHLKRDCPIVRAKQAQAMVGTENVPSVPGSMQSGGAACVPPASTGDLGSLRSSDASGRQPQTKGQKAACMPVIVTHNDVPVNKHPNLEKLGMAYSEVSAMMNRMPVVSGRLNPGDIPVSVLRDTGCSTCVVKTALVDNQQLTGYCQTVRLIDGTIKQFPVAKVELDCPYFSGEIEALCMPDCLCEVIVGNIEGAREPGDPNLEWFPRHDPVGVKSTEANECLVSLFGRSFSKST